MLDAVKAFFTVLWGLVLMTWKYWVALMLLTAAFQVVWYFLKEQRTYRVQDGKLVVRHGRLGEWEEVQEHLQAKHGHS
jgi:hypothetical protein